MMLHSGDYVLATKYKDGDPSDQWCVGFYDKFESKRYFVVDKSGKQFRSNGFRRVEKITKDRGEFLLRHSKEIDSGSYSLWWWRRCNMKNFAMRENI